ncbi:MAG: hypothetical protein MUF23_10870 [Pirellula sp.]|jgi:hypothetical protein|nr:hypothetical protein [Pirellula sp.]
MIFYVSPNPLFEATAAKAMDFCFFDHPMKNRNPFPRKLYLSLQMPIQFLPLDSVRQKID